MKLANIIRYLKYYLEDTRGEFSFNVKGHEVIANFTDKPNDDIFSRIEEILIGNSHIRQNDIDNTKLNTNRKEMV